MLAKYPVEKVEFAPDREFKDRDVKLTINWREVTYEVKRDYKSQETGNIALEVRCNNKPSGILASKADFIIFCLDENEFYFQKRWELLYRLYTFNKRLTTWGDGDRSEMFLIDKTLLPLLFNKL